MIRRAILTGGLATMLTLPLGCGGDGDEPAPLTGAETPDESHVIRGPIEMTLRASPGTVPVGGRVELTIDVAAETGVEIQMPQLGDMVESFAVREKHTPPDVPDGDRRRWIHRYALDTFETGQLDIPAVTVQYVDRRPEAHGDPPIAGELESDPLIVTVRSVLAEGETESDYRDIKDAVTVPVERAAARLWLLAVAIVVLGAIAGTVLALLARRRQAPIPERAVPPDEWALGELARLEADDLVGAGDFHGFYVRLSDIVRWYIERRFGLMAPERTTEEFLHETRRSNALSEGHKLLLAEFLRSADMVKFARHVPGPDDAGAALQSARGFVEDTAPGREVAA